MILHLIHNHIERGKGFDPRRANIAMDMIINHIIIDIHKLPPPLPQLTQSEVDEILQKNPQAKIKAGDDRCIILDRNYKGELIFELLYEWLAESIS